jgi:3'-5' exoribonuclease
VVSLSKSCDLISRNYPQINRDLLLTGAFLHDIGKIHELAYNRSFSYTTRGQLLGHMVIELEMLHAKIALVPGFPADLKTLIEHLIISHHGHYEFGSPKLPMFPEALVLHYLDDLDSKMESMRAHFEREVGSEGAWTSYNASLGRPLLDAAKLLAHQDDAKRDGSGKAAGNGAGKAGFKDSEETDSAGGTPSMPDFDSAKPQEPTSVTVAGPPEKI